ncbi:hypothetical protein C2S53_004839 [Perilla frutescens var. hirtella]|uniref:Polygalacturonase n=1 Tax=Perilla frutescens var. hirtella TaxID=608512 RepID=A0AAD4JHV5_PERFH|nr:hypothetical protein C2S53_004839 [Perilla frutescens var. hirtella]
MLLPNLWCYCPEDEAVLSLRDNSPNRLGLPESTFSSRDDCIAINGGNSDINISRITCGPGHGTSIGSLGKDGQHDEVEGIHVDNCTFIKTQNGARIKTWQGGLGFAKNIIFSNIIFISADNPMVIDQYYCPHQKCNDRTSAVEVSDVKYIGLRGTFVRNNGTINLSCSKTVPCTCIEMDELDIKGVDRSQTSARCINTHGTIPHLSNPAVDCLLP